MGSVPVREAYAASSAQYIAMTSGGWPDDEADSGLVRRHLAGVTGRVLDLGCGPGHWTAELHALGVEVTGIDMVPEFVAHARATYPDADVRLGSMTGTCFPAGSVAGILAWYSTIHLPPHEVDDVLVELRQLLVPGGTLVAGFFDSDDGVAPFDHAVTTAYRWPVEEFVERLRSAGLEEVERRRHRRAHRPDRRYAAVAARAV